MNTTKNSTAIDNTEETKFTSFRELLKSFDAFPKPMNSAEAADKRREAYLRRLAYRLEREGE